jgi:hypothetical protein
MELPGGHPAKRSTAAVFNNRSGDCVGIALTIKEIDDVKAIMHYKPGLVAVIRGRAVGAELAKSAAAGS